MAQAQPSTSVQLVSEHMGHDAVLDPVSEDTSMTVNASAFSTASTAFEPASGYCPVSEEDTSMQCMDTSALMIAPASIVLDQESMTLANGASAYMEITLISMMLSASMEIAPASILILHDPAQEIFLHLSRFPLSIS